MSGGPPPPKPKRWMKRTHNPPCVTSTFPEPKRARVHTGPVNEEKTSYMTTVEGGHLDGRSFPSATLENALVVHKIIGLRTQGPEGESDD